MATLWTFGDSFSTRFDDDPFYSSDEYIRYKGYVPKIYPQIISEKLNMNCEIYAKGGCDNYTILESVCEISNNVENDDVIIIGWSSFNRFRFINDEDKWVSILPFLPPFANWGNFSNLGKPIFDMVGVNRIDHEKKYSDEVNNWILLINKSFKNNKIIHWTPFEKSLINALYFKKINTIFNETETKIKDGHYSECGHKELANILLDMIIGREKRII